MLWGKIILSGKGSQEEKEKDRKPKTKDRHIKTKIKLLGRKNHIGKSNPIWE